jgi:predicted GNAT family N-acyltransferase
MIGKPSRIQPEIRQISAAQTLPLRLDILRPGRPVESAHFPGDEAPETRHFGAFVNGDLQGIASIFRAKMPERSDLPAFQLRGMATAQQSRGAGLGRALLQACIAYAQEKHAELLWCNARKTAVGFYQGLEFGIVGDEFEIQDVGPHFRMCLPLPNPGNQADSRIRDPESEKAG